MVLSRSTLCAAALLAALILVVAVEPALADPKAGNADVGAGLGKMLTHWAQYLIPGVVALVAIPAIARHDLGQAISILIVTLLVGGFAFMSQGTLQSVIGSMWNSIIGGANP